MRKQLHPIDDPRPRSSKIRISVNGIDSPIVHRRKLLPERIVDQQLGLLQCSLQIVTTGRQNNHLWLGIDNLLPGNTHRVLMQPAEQRLAASDLNHLRNPVTGTKRWIDPLQKQNPRQRTRNISNLISDAIQSQVHAFYQQIRFISSLASGSDIPNVLLDVGD